MKIEVANSVLKTFANSARIERRRGGWYVCWFYHNRSRGEIAKRWSTRRGQDFYPPWSSKWIGGGTSCTALSQLVRWLREQPVLPISTWRYWASETIKLLPASAVDTLLAGGYPEKALCVLCGAELGSLDWWSLNGISGPCCSWTSGCRQKVA
jgi:hypothetical protein